MPAEGASSLPPSAVEAAFTRLHIAPLDAELLKLVIPAAILPRARNISFHSVETLPERRFGFVDLPCADADKIRKKLHGAVLRGSKITVQAARTDDMPKPAGEAALASPSPAKEKKRKGAGERREKRKRSAETIPGIELEEGRTIKRGWTVPDEQPAKKEKGAKSKGTRNKKEARSK